MEKTIRKIMKQLKFLKNEYELLMNNLKEAKILDRSLPIRASSKATKEQKESINKLIKLEFIPPLKILSKMIDECIIEWDSCSDSFDLKELKIEDMHKTLFNEAMDRLYILKKERYDFEMMFIQECYLLFIKEIEKSDNQSLLEILDKIKRQSIETPELKKLITYKNVINVYKHGNGKSFSWIKLNAPNIIYKYSNGEEFTFNIAKVNFNDCKSCIENLLKTFIKL